MAWILEKGESMIQTETNRILLILRAWEDEKGLTLKMEGDKIRPSRPLTDDERELILQYRDLIASQIPLMTNRTKADDAPLLQAWYEESIHKAGERARDRRGK